MRAGHVFCGITVVGRNLTSSPTFAYIAGTSNCGSTLMSFLLNAQAHVTSVGEVAWSIPEVNPGSFICSCGQSLDTCQFWLEVGREMGQRGYLFDADHWNATFKVRGNRLIQRVAVRPLGTNLADRFRDKLVRTTSGWGKELVQIGKRNVALAESITNITGASVFVDASKDPARVRLLREYSKIEPYVIHLVRDAPAFVKSFIKKDARLIDKAIQWWNRTNWQMDHLKKLIPPSQWLLVRYEDVCADPETELQRILRFLGVEEEAPVLDFRRGPHHIIGNKMRLGDASTIRLDTSWREALSKAQVEQIIRSTKKYRQLLGYTQN